MRKAILLFVSCLTILGARAQHFEWATGYGCQREDQEIIGSVTDSLGNLYILGYFRTDAQNICRWDGHDGPRLLPMTPYGWFPDNINVVIAKISPNGEMWWSKVIHANNTQIAFPYDIRKVGDTAFACMVQFTLPSADSYLYYLDTLIPGVSDYPLPIDNFSVKVCTAFIMFDFNGNVLEQHFLHTSYLDANGNDFTDQGLLRNEPLWDPSFDIDKDGNIYLIRRALDGFYWAGDDGDFSWYSVYNGKLSGIKYWVDHRLVAVRYIDSLHRPKEDITMLMKFAPHFDTLLLSRYLIQSHDEMQHSSYDNYLQLDNQGGLYVIGNWQNQQCYNSMIIIDSTREITIPIHEYNQIIGYLVKFDTSLNALYSTCIEDSIWGNIPPHFSAINFVNITIENNLIWISGFVQKDDWSHSVYTLKGHPLGLTKNDAFVFSLYPDSGNFYSVGIIPSVSSSHLGATKNNNNLVAKNNRVFLQNVYYGGVDYPNENIRLRDNFTESMGLIVFDYLGCAVFGKDYQTYCPQSRPGPISLHDSILYLSNRLCSDATFGDIHVPVSGELACVAKYVDPAFMTPYVAPDPDAGTVSPDDETAFSLYPNPATYQLQIDSRGEAVTSVTAVNLHGQSVPLAVKGNHVDVGSLAPGLYILEITTTNHKSHLKFVKP